MSFANLEPDVEVLTEEQWSAAVDNTLNELGYTREEIRRQHDRGWYDEPIGLMVWSLVKDEFTRGERCRSS